jgi:hypothetical protein
MKKEGFLVLSILVIGFASRLIRSVSDHNPELLRYIQLILIALSIIYCTYLISTEKRYYIIVLLLGYLLGSIGDILSIYRLAGRDALGLIEEFTTILILIQLVIDNSKKKNLYLLSFSILMSSTILAIFILRIFFDSGDGKLLCPIVLVSGIILIIIKTRKDLPVESYLKLLTLSYFLGSFTTVINLIKS